MRSHGLGLAIFLVAAACTACAKGGPPPSVPTQDGSGEPPLHRLLHLTGRAPSPSLGTAGEARYTLPLSYPVVDAALERPLALPPFAAALDAALDRATGPAELMAALRPISPTGATRALPPTLASWAEDGPSELAALASPLALPTEILKSERGRTLTAHLPAELLELLTTLLTTMEAIEGEEWDLRGGSIRRPDRAAEEFFLDPMAGSYRFRTHPIGVQMEFLNEGAAINHQAISAAAHRLLTQVEALLPALQSVAETLPEDEGPLLQLQTGLGAVIVASRGPDLHAGDAFLLIDPGGKDEWTNNAGGNLGVPAQLALAIDLSGDDLYRASRPHTQGAGFMGLGILVDAGKGRDDYLGTSHAQGAGFLGMGILWDQGGDDAYQCEAFGQGAGTFGLGMLLDEGGDDRWLCAARCQGFGSTLGLGALIDTGGSDRRRLGVTGAGPRDPDAGGGQGASWGTRPFPWAHDVSLHGGVGLLYDRSGDDTYYARSDAQGAASFQSLGLLLDGDGDDHYVGELNSQGSASHRAVALLLDEKGDDRYEGGRQVQGAASDRSAGLLWDRGTGADFYRLAPIATVPEAQSFGGQGYGRQSRALGLLLDEGGDDLYDAYRDAQGSARPSSRPGRHPTGLLIDLGGTDRYTTRLPHGEATPAQGATWMDGSLGLGTDAESEALGWDPKPLAPEGGFGPAVWDGRRQPDGPWPALTEGDPEGPPEAQWLALTHLLRRSLEAAGAGDELPELPPWVETLATQSPSIPVRRAAGRVLTTHGKERGLQVLLQSLTFRSDDNPYIPQSGSIAAWVGRLIGQNLGSDPGAYRAWWRENKGDTSWLARLPAVQALDRAEIASSEGRVEDLREECKAAVKALPDAWGIRERAAELVGLWAWVLGHPESNVNADPATAAQLAQLAVSWDPRVPQYFIHLARALHRGGQTDLARRALEKAARVDPDHPELLALQRLVGDEEEQP